MYKVDSNEFRVETLEYLSNKPIQHRKTHGQYFTPKSIREELLRRLPQKHNPKILDPGCGTGEFLLTAKDYFKNAKIVGWDIDEELAEISRKLVPDAKIERTNALLTRSDYEEYDFVIGNPPYFEFVPDSDAKRRYAEVISGRVNIYSLFIYQSIKLLKRGGYLAFVVSPSMNNGAYFANLRRFIVNNCNIEYLSVLESPDLFHGALQSVMLLILKKGPNKGNYIFKKNGILIFSKHADHLNKAFQGKPTLRDLGYTVKTGRLVWNDHKDLLTFEAAGNTPLIWSYNVTSNGLKLGGIQRPQYVRIKDAYDIGPAIVVNRVVGKPCSGIIKAALVPAGMKFIGENHVNVIFPPKQASLLKPRRSIGLEEILKQLNSTEKLRVVQSITGNTQISKTELENLFPIDL